MTTEYFYKEAYKGSSEMIVATCATGSILYVRVKNIVTEVMSDIPMLQKDLHGAFPITRTEFVQRYYEMKGKCLPFEHHIRDMIHKETVKIAISKRGKKM